MPRRTSKDSLMLRVLDAIDSRPGEYLAVETIAQLAGCEKRGDRACLPGYIGHLSDKGELERKKIRNPFPGRTNVWGYRRTAAQDPVPEVTLSALTRRPLSVDAAARALASPPRGTGQRVPSLCNAPCGGKAAA